MSEARRLYLQLCIKQQGKGLELSQPGLSPAKRAEQAEKMATGALRKALHHWFEVTEQEFEAWRGEQKPWVTQPELDLEDATADNEDS